MSKVSNIVEGFVNLATDQNEAIAKVRLEICSHCPYFVAGMCTKCGCVTKAKVRVIGQKCPLKKW